MEKNVFHKSATVKDQTTESTLAESLTTSSLQNIRQSQHKQQSQKQPSEEEFYQNFPSGQQTNIPTRSLDSVRTPKTKPFERSQYKESDISKHHQNLQFPVSNIPGTTTQVQTKQEAPTISTSNPSYAVQRKGDNSAELELEKSQQIEMTHVNGWSTSLQMACKEVCN